MSCDTVKKLKRSGGRMMVFAAPSGSGKTTIVHHLLDRYDCLDFSISATTREKRAHEIDGKDYYFLTPEGFKKRIEEDAFVEWEEVYAGRFYGTLRSEVTRLWEAGKHILFDIDVKGARDIKQQYGERCLAVFVKPPSVDALMERLKNRNTETEASLKTRAARFKEELTYEQYFDISLINDDLETALSEAERITEAFLQIQNKEAQ